MIWLRIVSTLLPVCLAVSAAVQPAELYAWAAGGDQFERTISRLIEMQTRDYLSEPHLP